MAELETEPVKDDSKPNNETENTEETLTTVAEDTTKNDIKTSVSSESADNSTNLGIITPGDPPLAPPPLPPPTPSVSKPPQVIPIPLPLPLSLTPSQTDILNLLSDNKVDDNDKQDESVNEDPALQDKMEVDKTSTPDQDDSLTTIDDLDNVSVLLQ